MACRNPALPLVEITVHKTNKSGSRETRNILGFEEAQAKSQQVNARDLLEELKEVMTVNDMAAVKEFVKEFENDNNCNENIGVHPRTELLEVQLQRMKFLEEECRELKQEAAVYKSKNQEMREKVKVEEDAVDSLETQLAGLKKTLCQLTQNNTELLQLVLGQLNGLDHISKLEDERAGLTEKVRNERFFSSELHQKLLTINAVNFSNSKNLDQGQTLSQKMKSSEDSFWILHLSKPSGPYKPGTKMSQLTPLTVMRNTPLAFAPSFNDHKFTSDLEKEFHPVTLDLHETIIDSNNDSIRDMTGGIAVNQEQHEKDLITPILFNENLPMLEDLVCFTPDINNNNNNSDIFPTMSSLSETKFILGLEEPIEITDYETE